MDAQMVNPPMGFGRWILFLLIVVIPAILVGIGSALAFKGGAWMTIGLLLVMIGVGAVFTYYSDQATRKIKRYCVVAHFIGLMVLCANLGLHYAVSREVAAAEQVWTRRNETSAKALADAKERTKLQLQLNQSEKEVIETQTKADRAESVKMDYYRRLGVQVPGRTAAPRRPSGALASVLPHALTEETETGGPVAGPLTDEQVYEKWRLWLNIMAFIDAFVYIFLGGLLAALWEWDRNHDGIADHFQVQLGKA